MNEPTPEAAAAFVEAMSVPGHDLPHAAGQRALAFIRDAIHEGMGPTPNAIRQALGLEWEVEFSSLGTQERVVGAWKEIA